jgi:hypothetical protein
MVHQKADPDFLKDHMALNENKVTNIKDQTKANIDAEKLGFERSKNAVDENKAVADSDDDAKKRDPKSEESLQAVKMVNQMFKANGLPDAVIPEGTMSFSRIKDQFPFMAKAIEGQATKEAARTKAQELRLNQQDRNEQRQLSRDEMNKRSEERLLDKKEKDEKDDLIKLSTKLGDPQALASSLSSVDDVLGFKLDDAIISKDGTIKVGDKKVDLPGVSVPLLGRTSFYDSDARNLASSIGRVFNTELKDRSGAAVTSNEMERLKNEFGTGSFNTEAEMLGALQRYKVAVARALKNREAGFSPKIVEKYKEQGGTTSDFFTPKPAKQSSGGTSFPMTVRKGNQEATVKDASELAEANKEGFN